MNINTSENINIFNCNFVDYYIRNMIFYYFVSLGAFAAFNRTTTS